MFIRGFHSRLRGVPHGLTAFFALAFLLFSALTAQTASLVIDDFSYADDAAARAAWTAMAASPQVAMSDSGEWGSERVMRLPCNFTVQSDRCYWDRTVALDLSGYREFALEIFVPDPGAASFFSLYFRSGAGWYGNGVGIDRAGWSILHFSVGDFTEEGVPAGWDRVDGIRLSPWKGADRDTYLAVHELRAYTPLVYIIRDTQSAAPQVVDSTNELLSKWLDRYNLSLGVITGLDVEAGLPAGGRMAILPYNENVSSAQMTQFESFVAAGGKLMVYYLLGTRMGALLGFDETGWTPGDFAAYTLSDSVIRHLPARVSQDSWNIRIAAPRAEKNARVIATWQDSLGASTGYPAWLASDDGLFMSHILLGDDAPTKQFMLLVLIGHYVPEIWPDAAAAAILNIGRIAEYFSYEQAVPDIRATGALTRRASQVESALGLADAVRTRAITEKGAGSYPEAVLSAIDARSNLLNAYYLCQSPVLPEFRAVWEHSGVGPCPGDWAAAVKVLADNGFRAVFPNMLSGGLAHYDSALLPHSAEFQAYGDQIQACIQAAHARGIEVHVWKVNWNLYQAPQSFIDAMRAAGRTQVSAGGQPADWLCPSHPDNQALERDTMLEVVRNYDVDGIHFDYIRYPDGDHCYCPGCRARFEAETGNTVSAWPADVRSGGALEFQFLDWRRAQITKLVDAVYRGTKALKPRVKVSAAVFPGYAYCRDGVGQDWVDWIDKGIVDFLCPMDYTSDFGAFRSLVSEQLGYAAGRIPIYPGIGASVWSDVFGPDGVIVEIRATRTAGTGGFIIFNFTHALAEECLPALGSGTTAPAAGLKKASVAPASCPLSSSPDLGAIFPMGAAQTYIHFPWEDPGYRLPPTDGNSPPDNSCLIFYQVDGVNRIMLAPGLSNPQADIRIEAY